MSGYLAHVATQALLLAPAVLGVTSAVGVAGLPLFCGGLFVAFGAYGYALLAPLVGSVGALALAIVGVTVLFGMLARLFVAMERDDFAVASVALQSLGTALLLNGDSVTNGSAGIAAIPPLPGPVLAWAVGAASGGSLLFHLLLRTRVGFDLRALRDDQPAARSLGAPLLVSRQLVVAWCSGLGAATGGLYAAQIGFIDPYSLGFDLSVALFAAALIGGQGTWPGALAGAAVVVGLPELFRCVGVGASQAAVLNQIFFGAALVLLIRFRPGGLFGRHL